MIYRFLLALVAVSASFVSCRQLQADFVYLRESTQATAGDLSVQLDKLSAAGYIYVEKTSKARNPVQYTASLQSV